jgi:hypothetical protein
MSKNQELDATLRRLNRLSNDLEALIHRRARAMDSAPRDEFDELRRSVDAYFNSGLRSPAVDRKLGAALAQRAPDGSGPRPAASGNRARATDAAADAAAKSANEIYARRRQELREGRK